MSEYAMPDGGLRIVHGTWVKSADENYITARWCHFNGLFTDFAWLAMHGIEKYIKSALILNGYSMKQGSHNIVQLFQIMLKTFGSNIPVAFDNKSTNAGLFWREISPTSFIKHIF